MLATDVCDRCGFLAADYSERDLSTSPRWLGSMTDHMVEPVAGDVLAGPAIAEAVTALRSTVAAIDERRVDVDLVHRAIHSLRDLGRALHDAGAGAPSQVGTVAQLNISGGGVPKTPVLAAEVQLRGLVGDRQAIRKHHGRPFQALCLWSSEVIDALKGEGHPVHAGATTSIPAGPAPTPGSSNRGPSPPATRRWSNREGRAP